MSRTAQSIPRGQSKEIGKPTSDGGASPQVVAYVPALDGIRAVAVLGVLFFHFGVGWFAGGLLGVDVFFVLSGFLISSLLLREWASTGRLDIGGFYARRAKRLLPALLLMILLVAVYAAWFAQPDVRSSIRGDVLSVVGYYSNWHFVVSHQNYFQQFGPPSPLLHTWSLGVEEQFYLVWPAVTWLVVRRFGRKGLAASAGMGLIASFAATLLMSLLGVGTNRLYYGTDVRAQELMAGALLAVAAPTAVIRSNRRCAVVRSGRAFISITGFAALAALIWMFHSVSGDRPFLYRGGFLLVAGLTACLLVVAVYLPSHPVARALALPPVRYVGRISYGLYLFHYPLFLILDSRRIGLTGASLLAVRLGATFAVAVLSFHLIEVPVRNGRLAFRDMGSRRLMIGLPAGAGIAVAAVVVATTVVPNSVPRAVATGKAGAIPATPPPGLTGPHRVRVMLLGDSMALTLGVGLGQDSEAWGVDLINRGAVGCDLVWNQTVNSESQTNHAETGCKDWPTVWKGLVDEYQPDVVAVLLGRFEYQNRLINGHWYTVGQAPWDDMITSAMTQAIRVVSSDGARVALLTMPYVAQTTDAPDGTPWDVNQPVRTKAWNADLRRAAAADPRVATVVDLNHMVDPGDRYTSYVDGIRIREVDNEHFSPAGGLYVRHLLLPALVALGREKALNTRSIPSATRPSSGSGRQNAMALCTNGALAGARVLNLSFHSPDLAGDGSVSALLARYGFGDNPTQLGPVVYNAWVTRSLAFLGVPQDLLSAQVRSACTDYVTGPAFDPSELARLCRWYDSSPVCADPTGSRMHRDG